MGIDAIAERKKKQSRESKINQKKILEITKLYPVAGITPEGYIKLRNSYREIYAEITVPRKYDLDYLTYEELDVIEENSWKFMREFKSAVKEVYMNFPESNKLQQAYFKKMLDHTTNPVHLQLLQNELGKLKWLEKEVMRFTSFTWFFGKTIKELEANLKKAATYKVYSFEPISEQDKVLVLQLMNNTGGIRLVEEE
ncbi:hypothetical protein [Enterococcus faecalis]|uniref:hypothetical protein n=1 Tax=Enterococcus faecalis TaxID=1351 RepID=UPI0022A4D7BF|nr:hypothetical protein [Enterococcus faecalis]MEB8146436.1 hypothetical protein [Enterococcus faecalis]HCT9166088.1 hypothetical protein [Enterococcus faecalis]